MRIKGAGSEPGVGIALQELCSSLEKFEANASGVKDTVRKEVQCDTRGHVFNDLCWRKRNANFRPSQGERSFCCSDDLIQARSSSRPSGKVLTSHVRLWSEASWWVGLLASPSPVHLLKTAQHGRRGIDARCDPRDSPGHSQGSHTLPGFFPVLWIHSWLG